MNKQELIEHIKGLKNFFGNKEEYIEIDAAIKLIEQLDEPQKTIVPQFVVDWYKENKGIFEANLLDCIYEIFKKQNNNKLSEFEEWVCAYETKPFQTLVNMHQFGYTVKKEKRYLVKMKGMQKDCVALKKNKDGGYWYLSDTYPYNSTVNFHTRKELEEAGFGWVFDCEGIEIEEVE